MSGLLMKKQKEEEERMKIVVDMLKNKGNKKCHFKLMRHIDNERLLQRQVEQYKLNDFRAKSQL